MHLSSYQITRFQYAGLAPTELLAIDDHLMGCEFCRRQLRSNLNLPFAFRQLQEEFHEFPEERHIAPEDRTAYVQNRLNRVERELVMSHLQSCTHCKTQIELLQNETPELPHQIGNVVANALASIYDHAGLIWPIPITAFVVILLVALTDYWFFRRHEKTVVPPPIERTIQHNEPASISSPNGRVEFINSEENTQSKKQHEPRKSLQH